MTENIFQYQKIKLNYSKSGDGKKIMFLFHGFGQDHSAYKFIIPVLSSQYTVYSFDLFFHGKSEWNQDEKPLEKGFWKLLLEKFCEENAITTFSLAGFSIGCRFVLTTVEAFPQKTEEVFLLAPDGIKTNIWYKTATYPIVLRRFFKGMIHSPNRFLHIANTLHKIRIVDKGLVHFAKYQMDSEEKRKRVYYSWVVFRHLTFNLKKLAGILNERNTPVTVVVGKHDNVITTLSMNKFIKRLKNRRLEILETGHGGFLRSASLISLFKTL